MKVAYLLSCETAPRPPTPIKQRINAGLKRAVEQGKLGRPG